MIWFLTPFQRVHFIILHIKRTKLSFLLKVQIINQRRKTSMSLRISSLLPVQERAYTDSVFFTRSKLQQILHLLLLSPLSQDVLNLWTSIQSLTSIFLLESWILSLCWVKEVTPYVIPLIWNVQNRQILRDRKSISGYQSWEKRGMKNDCYWTQSFLGVGGGAWWKRSGNNNCDVYATLGILYNKYLWTEHLKRWILWYLNQYARKKKQRNLRFKKKMRQEFHLPLKFNSFITSQHIIVSVVNFRIGSQASKKMLNEVYFVWEERGM